MENILDKATQWLTATFDAATQKEVNELIADNSNDLLDRFYKDMEFGTGGMRGLMGAGTNRINKYTLGRATQGLSNYLIQNVQKEKLSVVIAYDCRHNSKKFAKIVADVLSANNISVFLFEDLRATPELSFAVRYLNCDAAFELTGIKLKKMILSKIINFRHDSIFEKVDYSERYFIYPIHMQPEASTLVQSPFHIDQKAAIINISRLLPLNTILYVKEHRSALGKQSLEFYRELKQHPNIKLISYRENMFELINNCVGTINLTSTVGLESLFFKKPSIVLGDVFYNNTGLTFRVNSFHELGKVVETVNQDGFKVDEYFEQYDAKLAYYIYCLNKKAYPFEFNVAKLDTKERVLRKENVEGFAYCINAIIEKNYNNL